jgi:bifunctional non-homologous end joining protein LigD
MARFRPMLARDGDETALDADGHIYEPKLDGIRALCYVSDGATEFRSRTDRDITQAYPELDATALPPCVLDGEIVLYDAQGHPDFSALLRRHNRKVPPGSTPPVTFAVFDVLRRGTEEVIQRPLEERKRLLSEIMSDIPPRFELTISTAEGRRLWNLMIERGLEGVIAKKLGSVYRPGARSGDWLKVKSFNTADVVITGYRVDRRRLSSLEVGAYDDSGQLVDLGRVGTGFSDRVADILRGALDRITLDGDASRPDDVRAVEPRLVAEVRFLHKTKDGRLRHASFRGIRSDKTPQDCRLDDIGV